MRCAHSLYMFIRRTERLASLHLALDQAALRQFERDVALMLQRAKRISGLENFGYWFYANRPPQLAACS